MGPPPRTTAAPVRQTRVYEPGISLLTVRQQLADIWDRRALVWHLSRTDKKASHYNTVMGRLWVVVDPLLTAFTFYIVRMVLIPPGGDNIHAKRWIAHLIVGVTVFMYFRKIFEGAARSIVSNKSMVLNSSAPRGVYPTVVLVRGVIDLLPAMLIYVAVHIFTAQPWGLSLLALPLILALLTGFGLGLGLVLCPLVVRIRDIGTFLPHLARIWLYVTPVMYLVAEIPDHIKGLLRFNPLYPFYAAMEDSLGGIWPDPIHMAASAAWCATLLLAGVLYFLRNERTMAIRL